MATADELDHRSFEIIYEEYHRDLTRFAAKQGSSDPEGVADLALLDGYRSFQRKPIRDRSGFRAYLYTAAKSHVVAESRRRAPAPTVVEPGRVAEPDFASWSVDGIFLAELLEGLSDDQRQVIVSRFYEGYTAEEIGERLGKSTNAVHQLQWRALAALRRVLVAAVVVAAIAAVGWLLLQSRETVVVDNSPARPPAEQSAPSEPTPSSVPGGPTDFQVTADSRTAATIDRLGEGVAARVGGAAVVAPPSGGEPDDALAGEQRERSEDDVTRGEAALIAESTVPPIVNPAPTSIPSQPDNGVDGAAGDTAERTSTVFGTQVLNVNSTLCLTGGTYRTVTQATCGAAQGQRWLFSNVGGNNLEVVDAMSGHCLDVAYGAADNGTGVGVYACHQGQNQQWQLQGSGGTTAIVNAGTGKCLDVPDSSTSQGIALVIWDCNGGRNQTWNLSGGTYPPPSTPVQAAPAIGRSLIASGSGLCLTAATGGPVTQDTCNQSPAQRWEIAGGAVFNVGTGQCLDITDGATINGTGVGVYGCHQGANQQWQLQSSGAAATLVNPATGRCLDVPGASTTPGTALIIWDCTNSQNQTWTLS